MASKETLSRLRDVLARELETITMYEAYAEAEADAQMKALFQHLADEEKEHVTEVYEALLVNDAAQKKWAESAAHAQAIKAGTFDPTVAAGPSRTVASSAPEAAAAPKPAPEAAPAAVAPLPVRPAAGKSSGIRPTPPTIGSLFGASQD